METGDFEPRATGLAVGDTTPAHPEPNMLVITAETRSGTRITEDLITQRKARIWRWASPRCLIQRIVEPVTSIERISMSTGWL
jgi:hypothetical protein